jgi:hypothetical protein
MPEGDVDRPPVGALSQVLDEPPPDLGPGIFDDRRDALGVAEHHPRPGNPLRRSARRSVEHHETIVLVIEEMLREFHPGKRFVDQRLQQGELLLAFFERLLHGDDAVAEHLGAGHFSSYLPKISREITTR